MATEAGLVAKSAFLLVETEATAGTDPSPALASNGVLAYEVTLNPLGNAESFARNPIAGNVLFGRQTPVPGKRHATCSFKIPLAGPGVALSSSGVGIPEWDPLMKACAWSRTFTANTSVVYEDQSTTTPCTIYMYVGPAQATGTNWKLYEMNGTAGNVKFVGVNGEPVMMEFEMVGTYVEPIDTTDPDVASNLALNEVVPEPLLAASFAFGSGWSSYSPCVNGFEYDPANVTVMRECINETAGYKSGIITDREPNLTFQMEEELNANVNMWSIYTAGTVGSASWSIGSDTGNSIAMAWNRTGVSSLSMTEREGVLALDVEATAAIDVSDQSTAACTLTIT
jgi:hypothetical protein